MQPVSRRTFLCSAVAAATAPAFLRGRYRVFASSTKEYPERVVRLMQESLVVDMLNQFLYRFDQKDLKDKWLTEPGAFTRADFDRFKSSGVHVVNFGDGADTFADAQALFGKWNSFIALYPQWLMRINSATEMAHVREQGKFGILFGLQSSAQFQTLDDVNRCYALGSESRNLAITSAA